MSGPGSSIPRRIASLGLFALVLALAASAGQDGDEIRTRLRTTGVRPDAFKLAPGIEGTLPGKAWRAEIGATRYLFFDLDGDGVLSPGTGDGLALAEGPFVVSLPGTLLVPEGQFTLSVDGRHLVLTPQELGIAPELVSEAALLNEMRLRGALAPVVIDVEASRQAAAHLDYLEYNYVGGPRLALDVLHHEEPGARGYTPEGARAGQLSVIGLGKSFREDLEGWYRMVYHGAKILDPDLRHVGVARRHEISICYPVEDAWIGKVPVAHPADGARNIPLEYARGGEIPNPAPGTDLGRGCGFPLVVHLPRSLHAKELVSFQLLDPKDRVVEGFASSPSRPANEALPDNLGCAFFIPRAPLQGGTRYRARLEIESMDAPLEWSFTTEESGRR